MVMVQSFTVAVILALISMFCWGSWANTQKSATRHWAFQLFYWDFVIGLWLFSLLIAFTAGSLGDEGRSFLTDLAQARGRSLISAFMGGVIFNAANILLVSAVAIAGMAVAFPVGIGLALVLGVIINYGENAEGNPLFLFIGVALVTIAIVLDAKAYRRSAVSLPVTIAKGIVVSLLAGFLMSLFYRYVTGSMETIYSNPVPGKLTPYTALVIFATGALVSNFVWNSVVMYRPFSGEKVTYRDYFTKGTSRIHLIGLAGGAIWSLGMIFNLLSGLEAGFAIAYGLGQGGALIAALYGIFTWKEFKGAKDVKGLLTAMFLFFIAGVAMIILASFF